MATDIDIANLALTRLGHDAIGSFSATGNKASRWFHANYGIVRRSVLRAHPWNFAIRRDVPAADPIRTITGITQANPAVVTSADHGFADGERVYITGVTGMAQVNNRVFTLANRTTDTFELSGIDSSSYAAYASGGSLYGYVPTEHAHRFALPPDCLRLLRINGAESGEYRVEQGAILTDERAVHIEYVSDATDEGAFDAIFTDLLAARLSAEICFYLTDNSTLTEQAWKIHDAKLREARGMDAREGTPRGILADTWLNARI